MGAGSNKRVQDRVTRTTKTDGNTSASCVRPSTDPSNGPRDSRALQGRGNITCRQQPLGLCKPDVPCPEDRCRMEICHKPQEPEPVCDPSPLQDGINSYHQRTDAEGRLADKARLERHLPNHPHCPDPAPSVEIPLGRSDVRVQGSPMGVHKGDQTDILDSTETGDTSNLVPRRHAHHVPDSEQSLDQPGDSDDPIGLGFMVNIKKSVLSPTQQLDFLGFTLNSQLLSRRTNCILSGSKPTASWTEG